MTEDSTGVQRDLTVTCVLPNGDSCEGVVVDVLGTGDPGRLVVSFTPEESPRLAVGSLAELHLNGPSLSEPLRTDAHLIYRTRESTGDVVQFAVAGEVAAAMDVVVLRRRSFRVQPEEAMQVELRSSAGSVGGRILDLSVYGASVAVPAGEGVEALAEGDLRIRFHLPGEELPIEMAGSIQTRGVLGQTVRLGVEFDSRATLDYAANENRVAGYVLSRQTQVLKALIRRR
jgi:hypothetical protein